MAPTTFATGYLYAGMGFTTVNEAAVPVLSARHTHEELADIPIVDKASLTLMANNEIMLDQMQDGEYELEVATERVPAALELRALYDPRGIRMRS